MASYQTLSLEGRGLKLDTAADIDKHVVPLLTRSASITSLNLSGNTIGVEAAEALAPHLSKLTSLQNANLADIFTSRLLSEIPPALDALLTALLQLKSLHTINLSDNAFGLKTQAPLVKFLERHVPLRHLILNNNGLGPEAGNLVAEALTRLAEAKSKAPLDCGLIETIVCGRNRLENGSAGAWARTLAIHASGLKELRMAQNGIRVEGISEIIREGLRYATKLKILELQDNLFTSVGARALVESMEGWPELEELAIQDTLLRPRGGTMLCDAFSKGKNKKLVVLRLQYNEMNARGIKSLAQALQRGSLPNLRRIELNGNKFSEDDASIEEIREILDVRKEAAGINGKSDGWGLDELDELEDESSDDDDGDDEREDNVKPHFDKQELNDKFETKLKLVEEADKFDVPHENDASIDELADQLNKTSI